MADEYFTIYNDGGWVFSTSHHRFLLTIIPKYLTDSVPGIS